MAIAISLHPLDMVLWGGLNGLPFFMFMDNLAELKKNILDLAGPIAEAQNLEIWGIEIIPGSGYLVRLYIDLPQEYKSSPELPGADKQEDSANAAWTNSEASGSSPTIEQCESISRQLGLAMDVEDRISVPWTLEVSTPGLERKFFALEQLRPYVGELLDVLLHEAPADGPYAGRKSFRGRILAVDESGFQLQPCTVSADGVVSCDRDTCQIEWNNVRRARKAHIFVMPKKPGKSRKKAG